tara:strand:+ start:291 stop:515 length:225 start_codon:yes stop_codon:yes gene_type:complete
MAEISELERKRKKQMQQFMQKSEEPKFIMRIDDKLKEKLVTLAKANQLDMTAYITKLLREAWDEYLIVNQEEKK